MLFFILFLLYPLLLPPTALADIKEIALEPKESAIVTSYFPDKTEINPEKLRVGFTSSHTMSFLRFSTKILPPDAKVIAATLSAYLTDSWGEEVVKINTLEPLSDWCLSDLSWNKKPPMGRIASFSAVSSQPGWISWDITETVRSWLNKENFGIVLDSQGGNFERAFAGINSDKKPVVNLTFNSSSSADFSQAGLATFSAQASQSDKPCAKTAAAVKGVMTVQRQRKPLLPAVDFNQISRKVYLGVVFLTGLSAALFFILRGRQNP